MAATGRRVAAQGPAVAKRFVSRVARTIERRGLLRGGERVVVAVSGGPDSLALLHALARLAPGLALHLHVGHFDHRARPGSAADARSVQRHAARLGLPFAVGTSDGAAPAPGRSPEEVWREQRQRFLLDLAERTGGVRIATGHTMDDQAETVLMRLLQGTGPRGLGGIPPLRRWWIRPLIDLRRADTEAFCRALRLRPRRDPTNEDPRFRRNLIRRETIPFLERSVNARLVEALARLADVFRDEDHYLHGLALSQAPPEPGETGDAVRLSVEAVRALPVPLQRRAVRYLLAVAGLDAGHGHTEAVRQLALGGETGARLDLPGPLNARLGYGFLVVGRALSDRAPEQADLAVPGETDLPDWGVRARAWIGTERPETLPDGRRICVLDADRISLPLRVRRWRTGDRFRPLGMSRLKKVGDFFTDEKVEKAKRAAVPLVVAADGTIVWVTGHRIDDRAKVAGRTRRFLWLEVE